MSNCQRCFNLTPSGAISGIYKLEQTIGENRWFAPNGRLIDDTSLLAILSTLAIASNEIDCTQLCNKNYKVVSFTTTNSITLPAGLHSVRVRNKGSKSIYINGIEVCANNLTANQCESCTGESLSITSTCGFYDHPISVNVIDSCAEITLEYSPNPYLDLSDNNGDGIPDWLETLNPCLSLPEPDVSIYALDGVTLIGKAYSFSSNCFNIEIQDLANNVSYYAAAMPLLNKEYIPQMDLANNITHYILKG